jgi:hypothetical protein
MRNKRIFAVLVLIGLLLLIAGPAAADKGGDPASFQAISLDCSVTDPGTGVVDANGILHIRGVKSIGIVESDNPLVAGTDEVEVNADINMKTNTGKFWINLTIHPTGVDGAWVAPGESGAGPSAPVIHHGYGTGALAGMRIMLSASGLPDGYPGPGEAPCAPIRVLQNRGVIVDKPGAR